MKSPTGRLSRDDRPNLQNIPFHTREVQQIREALIQAGIIMKVYVIMSNDYPDAVFRRKDEADAYVALKKKDEEQRKELGHRMIYWRVYDFDLQE